MSKQNFIYTREIVKIPYFFHFRDFNPTFCKSMSFSIPRVNPDSLLDALHSEYRELFSVRANCAGDGFGHTTFKNYPLEGMHHKPHDGVVPKGCISEKMMSCPQRERFGNVTYFLEDDKA